MRQVPSRGGGGPAGLVGRDGEVRRLAASLGEAVEGRGRVVVVEGEAGIGKTSILDAVCERARRLGARVLRGSAEEFERQVPFALIGACLGLPGAAAGGGPLDAIDRMLQGDGVGAGAGGRGAAGTEFAVTEAILALLDDWCGKAPVALVLDDLHWADPASLFVLHRLGRTVASLPLLVLASRRPTPRSDELGALLRSLASRGSETVRLEPLEPPAVGELALRLAGAPPGEHLRHLLDGAGGNPLYLTELLAALGTNGRLALDHGTAEAVGGAAELPESLAAVIGDRLAFLPAPTLDVLRVAAVLGSRFDATELSAVLRTPLAGLLDALQEALDARILTGIGDRLAFRHELIRRVMHDGTPATVRAAIHQEVCRALMAAGAPVERIAEHLAATPVLAADGVGWLAGAAAALTGRAPGLAVDLLRRALAGLPPADPLRATVELCLARAQLWAGEPAQAEQTARGALAVPGEGEAAAQMHWILAQACAAQGRLDAAIVEVERALHRPGLSAEHLTRFHGLAAQCLTYLVQLDRAAESAERAIASAGTDPRTTSYALHSLARVRNMQMRQPEALALAEQALAALGDRSIPPDLAMAPHLTKGVCLLELDRLAEADEPLITGLRLDERAGGSYTPTYHLIRATLRFWDGRWDDALAEIAAGLETTDRLGLGEAMHALAALIAVHRGDPSAGADLGTQSTKNTGGDLYELVHQWAAALSREAGKDQAGAFGILLEQCEKYPFASWGHFDPHIVQTLVYLCPDAALLAAALGEKDFLRRLAAAIEPFERDLPRASLTAHLALCRGLADDDAALVADAIGSYRRSGRVLFEAYAQEGRAVLLARAGSLAEARQSLDEALHGYQRLDASWTANRARTRLRAQGMRLGPRGPHRHARTGWEALTRTELQVAHLVAQGHSNPEIAVRMFLSRRTVQTHVSHILHKLDVTSRMEVAAIAHRH
jgi:DNA-binding CsgD family transcriptional regulator